jgi:hypothetical protein
MKITFEEYLDSYKDQPEWMPRPTIEEYESIQEECLLAEFLGYQERPNTILYRWDEQAEVWYDQRFEYGLYLTYDPIVSNRKVFEGNDELIIGEMRWKSWDNLMMIVDKVRSFKDFSSRKTESDEVRIDRFSMGKTTISMDIVMNGNLSFIYHCFDPNCPEKSDCESYIEAVYKAMIDVAKFIKENDTATEKGL